MSISETMKGVQLVGHGGPEQLVWNEAIPVPEPEAGEVLVRVLAAGVNNTDINTRIGWYSSEVTGATGNVGDEVIEAGGWGGALGFPRIQGSDLCGEVVALGDGVTGLKLGARVTCPTNQPIPTKEEPTKFEAIGSEYDGAFAEYCTLPAGQVFDVTASPLSDVEIGVMPCAYGTAFNLLNRAGVTKKDHVLVTGASGGVGLAAVQLAKHLGAKVTAISSAAKAGAVRDAGADFLLDRGDVPGADSVSVVIDIVGGDGFAPLLDALKPGGRYATSGAIAGPIVQADLRVIYLKDLTIFGCTYTPRGVFAGLVDIINQGAVRPLVSKSYPLKDITRAQEEFASKRYPGKLVLIP